MVDLSKYRIVKIGNRFYYQRKVLWIWWTSYENFRTERDAFVQIIALCAEDRYPTFSERVVISAVTWLLFAVVFFYRDWVLGVLWLIFSLILDDLFHWRPWRKGC